jgi:CubicO group peptidase (beta-lactamase class C family)
LTLKRALKHSLWIAPALVLVFLVVLWVLAGFDARYVWRVLVHRDSSTDDYEWKDAVRVPAAASPLAWHEAPACDAVAAALRADPDAPDLPAYLQRGGALGFVLIRDGAIACEWYGNGGRVDRPAAAFSVSKTVTSLLLARAVDEGKVPSLDQPITDGAPALRSRDPRFAAITLAALVDMRSGIAFDDDTGFPWVTEDAPAVYYATDLAATVLDRVEIQSPPGRFVYNDYAPNLIGLALERAYGERVTAEPMRALWSVIGAEFAASWSVDDDGFAWHESGFVVTARDLARIGVAMVDGGMLGGRRVAPAAFVSRSFDPAGRSAVATFAGTPLGYRNGWWVMGDGTLVAMGRHGQIMLVSPATRTVVVRLGIDGYAEPNVAIANRFHRLVERLAGQNPRNP